MPNEIESQPGTGIPTSQATGLQQVLKTTTNTVSPSFTVCTVNAASAKPPAL